MSLIKPEQSFTFTAEQVRQVVVDHLRRLHRVEVDDLAFTVKDGALVAATAKVRPMDAPPPPRIPPDVTIAR